MMPWSRPTRRILRARRQIQMTMSNNGLRMSLHQPTQCGSPAMLLITEISAVFFLFGNRKFTLANNNFQLYKINKFHQYFYVFE